MKNVTSAVTATLLCILAGCGNLGVYSRYESIPGFKWDYGFKPVFTVEIADTAAAYNLFVNVRHTSWYPYSNIWIRIQITHPSGKKDMKPTELSLADASGKWHGEGLGDIYDVRVPLQGNARFREKGSYRFEMEQNMRVNPLPGVMEIGLEIGKADGDH